jgi:hypothetical protein
MHLSFRRNTRSHLPPETIAVPGGKRGQVLLESAANASAQTPVQSTETEPLTPTIFHEPWWLEIAGDGAIREVTVSTGGMLVGRLPYLLSRRAPGLTKLSIPRLTHVLGPAILEPSTPGGFPNPGRQIAITRDLISQLPKASHISFRLHRGITNTLAFDAAGYTNSVGYTVEIPPVPAESLWLALRDKTRNVIRRAQEVLDVETIDDPEAFMDFYEANLRAKGLRSFYDRRICSRLMTACQQRGAGRMLTARDRCGRLQSAILTVWDRTTEYYFMSTRTPDSHNGATSLVLWTALQQAARNGLTFDMDGLHVTNHRVSNLGLLAGFGGAISPRYTVRRSSIPVQAARCALDLLQRL